MLQHFAGYTGAVDVLLYPDNTIARVSESLALTCTAAGIPAPEITWFKDDILLTDEAYNITERQFSNDSSHYTVSVLNLCDLQLSDSGEYSCTASNTITEGRVTDTRSFMLEAQGELAPSCGHHTSCLPPHSLPQHHCSTRQPDCQRVHSSRALLQCVWPPSATSAVVYSL